MVIKVQSRDIPAIMRGDMATPGSNRAEGVSSNLTYWMYNALDSAVTLRVHEALAPKLAASPHATISYNFVRAMQGPALDMMTRGIMVNQRVRQDETERYTALRQHAQHLLDQLANAVWGPERYVVKTKVKESYTPIGKRGQPLAARTRILVEESIAERPLGLNPNSVPQVLAFFNIALKCEPCWEVRKTPTGTIRTPSANNKALRKWAEARTKGPGVDPRDRNIAPVKYANPFVQLILTIRDCDKALLTLNTALDADGRMRCSYNVVGSETGRWSSSANAFGRGTNLQNQAPTMRRMFCADDGHWFISTDLEQAESRLVAGLVWQCTGDDTYWKACESADLHTTVAMMSWPELPWTDDMKVNRKIADQPYPGLNGKFSYRDVAKRVGHGSSYFGTPYGIALAVGIPVAVVEGFQRRFFAAFKGIPLWHQWTRRQLLECQFLDTPLGRRRWFFGRPNEDSTLREAIAHVPQSTIGETLNLAMYNCWRRSKLPKDNPLHLPIQLLLQNHDAFAFQTPLSTNLPTLLAAVKAELEIPIPLERNGETKYLVIPGEFVTGFNWGYRDNDPNRASWKFEDGNPDGLSKWRGSDTRTRTTPAHTSPGDWLSRPLR